MFDVINAGAQTLLGIFHKAVLLICSSQFFLNFFAVKKGFHFKQEANYSSIFSSFTVPTFQLLFSQRGKLNFPANIWEKYIFFQAK